MLYLRVMREETCFQNTHGRSVQSDRQQTKMRFVTFCVPPILVYCFTKHQYSYTQTHQSHLLETACMI